jgi:transcriptional regulator with XRE-family HTH domain
MSKPIPEDRDIDPIVAELRKLRLAAKMHQPELATELGFESGSSVSGYERGDMQPRLDVLHAWAGVFGHKVVLVKGDAPAKRAPRRKPDDEKIEVSLTKYQIALAMGYLIVVAKQMEGKSSLVSEDLLSVADEMARALGGS